MTSSRPAFTLVELLVVIGIIALLISILLPSLGKARRQAQVTACSAKLHNMMLAAQMHRQEHQDYYPLAGVLPGYNPTTLDDIYCQKYDYYLAGLPSANNPEPRQLCPITYALLTEMQGGKALNGPSGIMDQTNQASDDALFLDPGGLMRNFLCPSQATSPLDVQPRFVYLWQDGPGNYVCQPQSYIFNEYIVGWDNANGQPGQGGFLQGKGSLIHQAASTMFAADGLGGSTLANHALYGPLPVPMYTVYPNTGNPTTLADAYQAAGYFGAKAGDKACFDLIRHGYRMNIAFCDGHVECRRITNPNSPGTAPDLANIWIEPP